MCCPKSGQLQVSHVSFLQVADHLHRALNFMFKQVLNALFKLVHKLKKSNMSLVFNYWPLIFGSKTMTS